MRSGRDIEEPFYGLSVIVQVMLKSTKKVLVLLSNASIFDHTKGSSQGLGIHGSRTGIHGFRKLLFANFFLCYLNCNSDFILSAFSK